jgi:hypothetical protein
MREQAANAPLPQRPEAPADRDAGADQSPPFRAPGGSSLQRYFRAEALAARHRLDTPPHPKVPFWLLIADALFLLVSLATAIIAFWFTRLSGN